MSGKRFATWARSEIDFVHGPAACSPYYSPWFSIVSLLAMKPKVGDRERWRDIVL